MKPTTYKKEYCKKAYDFLSAEACRGIAALAAHLNTSERTVFDWRRNNPEFKQAVEDGMAKSKALFIAHAYDHIVSTRDSNFNSPLFIKLANLIYQSADQATVVIEGWDEAKDYDEKRALVADAMVKGYISPEQADKIASVVEKTIKPNELDALHQRLYRIEALLS